jgi:hypothetical protein
MKRAALVFPLCLAAALAASNWSVPLLGIARDAKNQLHPVYGVAGNFVLRGSLGGESVNWAFAASGGLVEADGELRVLDAHANVIERRPVPANEVILSPRYAFFPKTGELWPASAGSGSAVVIEPTAIAGRVIALGPADQRGIVIAACRANQLWLLTFDVKDGALTHESAPGGTAGELACTGGGALLVLRDRLLLTAEHELVIQTTAGNERRLPIPPNHGAEIHRAGEDTVQIELPGSPSRMVLIAAEGERLYELPAGEARP